MTISNDIDDTDFDMAANLDEIRKLVAQRQLSEAAARCKTIQAHAPQTAGVIPLLAVIRLMEDDVATALSVLQSGEHLYGAPFAMALRQAEAAMARDAAQDAAAFIRQAIVMEPYRKEAASLFQAGRREEAKAVMIAGHRTSYWYRGNNLERRDGRPRVASFYAMAGGSTPTRFIIDPARFDLDAICMLEGFDYPIDRLNRCFDIVFMAASDPDWDQTAIDVAADLASRLSIPVINAPAAMNATMRHLTAEHLQDIPGLYVPQTRRFQRQELIDKADTLLAGLSFPVLLRPAGSHGGNGLVRTEDQRDLLKEAAAMASECVYVTEYYDFASADGLYRKLRIIFVDGTMFPYHLSISDHWLNHYYRTRTAEEEALQAEERVYLNDPEAYLGPVAYKAAQEIATRHPLGFYGLDGAIDRDGRLVLFECNATMLVKSDFHEGKIDHKRPAAEAIRSAMTALILKTVQNSKQAAAKAAMARSAEHA